jgi:hypothetical protein
MNWALIAQYGMGVLSLIPIIWAAIQIYSWVVGRARLIATVRYSLYTTDPRYVKHLLLSAASLAFQGETGAVNRLSNFADLVVRRDFTPVTGDHWQEGRAFFEISIRNQGNTTLESVRLTSTRISSARIIRPTATNELLELSGEAQAIPIGTLVPGDEVTVHAWGQQLPSVRDFKLTHSKGRGRVLVLYHRRKVFGVGLPKL